MVKKIKDMRIYPEKYSNEYLEDYSRIIRSNSFRRMAHKAQVFLAAKNDHRRNRMTHSMEVAYIARYISYNLGINSLLAEAIAICHDLGHPPFGHRGEAVLSKLMKEHNMDFCHNNHGFKIITSIEKISPNYEGLNLTIDTLEGFLKRKGKISESSLSEYILEYVEMHSLNLDSEPKIETRIASISDDIAYLSHDVEDAIKSEAISIKHIRDIIGDIENYSEFNITHSISNFFIKDLIENSSLDKNLISFSDDMKTKMIRLKKYMFEKLYTTDKVIKHCKKYEDIISGLFYYYMESNKAIFYGLDEGEKAIKVCDYISGMTDRFAIEQFEKKCNIKNIWVL